MRRAVRFDKAKVSECPVVFDELNTGLQFDHPLSGLQCVSLHFGKQPLTYASPLQCRLDRQFAEIEMIFAISQERASGQLHIVLGKKDDFHRSLLSKPLRGQQQSGRWWIDAAVHIRERTQDERQQIVPSHERTVGAGNA